MLDMCDFYYEKGKWSQETFGVTSERGPLGPLDHLEEEIQEARLAFLAQDRDNLKEEIADLVMLVFDVAYRSGLSYDEVVKACNDKFEVNKKRKFVKGEGSSYYKGVK